MKVNFCVIGGGIVGLATAMRLLAARPGASLVLIEKEAQVGQHQTGHNSGVVHAGVYYAPGSLKARFSKAGAATTKAFAAAHGIPLDVCGKLLVATSPMELQRMAALKDRAINNKLEVTQLSESDLRAAEPDIAGLGALHVPSSAIVDYRQVSHHMAETIRAAGGQIMLGAPVVEIAELGDEVVVSTPGHTIHAEKLVVCAGLQSDRLARLAGLPIDFQIVPFRGEYYRVQSRITQTVRHLIYPIPDPALPFLGIHLTRIVGGGLTIGPNAVIGLSREGYPRFSCDARDMLAMARFSGFWRVARQHWRSALGEFRNSLSKARYLREAQKYCPSLQLQDLAPHPAGIRAQAVMADGSMAQDFIFLATDRMLHVCNAPSPGATAAIPFAQHIVARLLGEDAVPDDLFTGIIRREMSL